MKNSGKKETLTFLLDQFLDQKELKQFNEKYTDVMQQLQIAFDKQCGNKPQLLIGAYRTTYSEFKNDVSEIKWKAAVLYRLLVDLTSQSDIDNHRIMIAENAPQQLKIIIKTNNTSQNMPLATKIIILCCIMGGLLMLAHSPNKLGLIYLILSLMSATMYY